MTVFPTVPGRFQHFVFVVFVVIRDQFELEIGKVRHCGPRVTVGDNSPCRHCRQGVEIINVRVSVIFETSGPVALSKIEL